MPKWVDDELRGLDLGDARCNRRMGRVVTELSEHAGASLPTACGGWAETMAAYRFFANRRTTPEKVLAPHVARTLERLRAEPAVLLLQDTTELDFTGKGDIDGLGPLNWKERQGFFCHPTVAVTPDRRCLGTVDLCLWTRDGKAGAVSRQRGRRVLAEKQSRRWVEGYEHACALAAAAPATQVTCVADREGDIYEWFVAAARKGVRAEWIVRACQDRRLSEREPGAADRRRKLWSAAAAAPVLGRLEWLLPGGRGRRARRVTQELRGVRLVLHPPYRREQRLPAVAVNAVLATEINPPPGERPVTWLLLTSLPVDTLTAAKQVVEFYLCRWQIEVFFNVLKNGCRIETLHLQTLKRLSCALALNLIVAWRVLAVTMAARTQPDEPCTVYFAEEEWRALYQIKKRPVPATPPSLGQFVKVLASLGGYLGRKSDGPPGVRAVWIGLQQLHCFALAWQVLTTKLPRNCV